MHVRALEESSGNFNRVRVEHERALALMEIRKVSSGNLGNGSCDWEAPGSSTYIFPSERSHTRSRFAACALWLENTTFVYHGIIKG